MSSALNSSGRGCCKGNWSGINIAAMVIGFVLFWPVGLVVLYWNISGRNVQDLPSAVTEKWNAMFNGSFGDSFGGNSGNSQSKNSVFDEFQQTQYDRISELKDEIKNRASRFSLFQSDAKRRADEAEFSDFMSNKPDNIDNKDK